MDILFEINNKKIYDIDYSVLYTSEYNNINDLVELTNAGCEVITKNSHVDIDEIPEELLKEFQLDKIYNKKKRTKIDEIKLRIVNSLVTKKKIIVFNNLLTYLDNTMKEKIIKKLKMQNKRIINYTTEIEECLYLDYMMVLHQNQIIMEGRKEQVLLEEKILKKLGFKEPIIIELSKGLQYYDLVSKVYYNPESLVNDLWK